MGSGEARGDRPSDGGAAGSQARPNVLLFLTDDQGWDDLGLHGNRCLETPRLDALGRESVRFDHFYAAPVCAPTRAALLTGRHFLRTGVSHVHGGKDFIHPDEVLLPELFRRAGYRTGMWGKWHSGKTSGYLPWERGFDEAYMARLYQHRDSEGRFNGAPRRHTGWTVDTLADYAVDFIARHRDRPWFAFVPHLCVHTPLLAPAESVARYERKGIGQTLATLYAMLGQMDAATGRVLDAVDGLGLAGRTIVVFLSDNGPQFLGDALSASDLAVRTGSGLKGHKGSMWENGIRVPLFVRWPGRLQPRVIGRVSDVCDLLPTLLDLCGIALSPGHAPLDGRSVRAWIEGREGELAPRASVIASNLGWPPEKSPAEQERARLLEYRPVAPEEKAGLDYAQQLLGVRTESHKLLRNEGYARGAPAARDGRVLVRIETDPREDRNVLDAEPDVGRSLDEGLRAWFEGIKADPHSYHAPVFAVGPGTTGVVLLYAPVRVRGGLVNAVHACCGWTARGDGADYALRVTRAGRYAVRLDCRRAGGGQPRLRLRIGADERRLEPGAGGGAAACAEFTLPAGDGVLSLDAVADAAPAGAAAWELGELGFEWRE
jgi:arylsulfatase A-like enzyme